MDKKIHKKVILTEAICLFVGILCMFIGVLLHHSESMSGIATYRRLLSIFGIVCEFIIVSIELFLFYLEEKKYKLFTVGYYVLELLCVMLFNFLVPFLGIFILISFNALKNIYRYFNVEYVYKRLGYYELCKKFGIKVKRPRRARATAVKKSTPVKKTKRSTRAEEPTYA